MYQGVIKSFNPTKGWGFIECEQTKQLYGKDMFVLKTALPGGMANKGDQVYFSVVQEHNGPIASDVQIVGRVAAPAPAIAAPRPMAGAPVMAANMAANGGSALAPVGQSYIGTVKSFNQETGWGMIASQQMTEAYGKDVFFSKSSVYGGYPAAGEQVAFTLKMEAKGPAAASVQVLWKQPPAMAALPSGMGMCMGMGMGLGPRAPKMPARDQSYFGSLKTFNEEKGWGHINCEATKKLYGKDVFLMRTALQGQVAQVGALMSFKVTMGVKGPQANGVMLLPPGAFRQSSDPPSEEVAVYVGQVKSFNAEKGWGFVASEDLHSIFGKDIFIHKREFEGFTPSQGEEVRISVEIDDGGQPVAKAPIGTAGMYAAAKTNIQGFGARVAPY